MGSLDLPWPYFGGVIYWIFLCNVPLISSSSFRTSATPILKVQRLSIWDLTRWGKLCEPRSWFCTSKKMGKRKFKRKGNEKKRSIIKNWYTRCAARLWLRTFAVSMVYEWYNHSFHKINAFFSTWYMNNSMHGPKTEHLIDLMFYTRTVNKTGESSILMCELIFFVL